LFSRSWVKGVLGSTVTNVVSHQFTRKGEDEEEEEEGEGVEGDVLEVPGRVYYIKPRKLHGGATMKEVSGNGSGGTSGRYSLLSIDSIAATAERGSSNCSSTISSDSSTLMGTDGGSGGSS